MTQCTYIRHIEHTWAYMSIWFNLSHHNLMRLHQNHIHGHSRSTPQWSKNDGSPMFLNQTSSTPWYTQHPHNIPIVHSSMKGGPAFASTLEWDRMDRPYPQQKWPIRRFTTSADAILCGYFGVAWPGSREQPPLIPCWCRGGVSRVLRKWWEDEKWESEKTVFHSVY